MIRPLAIAEHTKAAAAATALQTTNKKAGVSAGLSINYEE
jgi:hypothetical protein